MSKRKGYRGYITSRPIFGSRTPQHVQNLVIRDYAQRKGLTYRLSATEYAMEGCCMMLHQILEELPDLEGVIAYSLFMLPQRAERRRAVCRRVLDSGARLHMAVEEFILADETDVERLENLWTIHRLSQR